MTTSTSSAYCQRHARTFKPLARDLAKMMDTDAKGLSEQERQKRLRTLAKFLAAIFEVYTRRDADSAVTVFLMTVEPKEDIFVFALALGFSKESPCMNELIDECSKRPGIKLHDKALSTKILKFGGDIDKLMKKTRKLTKLVENAFKYKPRKRTVH